MIHIRILWHKECIQWTDHVWVEEEGICEDSGEKRGQVYSYDLWRAINCAVTVSIAHSMERPPLLREVAGSILRWAASYPNTLTRAHSAVKAMT